MAKRVLAVAVIALIFLIIVFGVKEALASHSGVDKPRYDPIRNALLFPCHGINARRPIGAWTNITNMDEVFYIGGLFDGTYTIEEVEAWAKAKKESGDFDSKLATQLLNRDSRYSLFSLYTECAKPYLEEQQV